MLDCSNVSSLRLKTNLILNKQLIEVEGSMNKKQEVAENNHAVAVIDQTNILRDCLVLLGVRRNVGPPSGESSFPLRRNMHGIFS